MPPSPRVSLLIAATVAAFAAGACSGADVPPAVPGAASSASATVAPSATAAQSSGSVTPSGLAPVEEMRLHAGRLKAFVHTDGARAFLDAVTTLPKIAPRSLFHTADRSRYHTAREAEALSPAERAALVPLPADEELYYYTRFGTPLSYARPLDVAFSNGLSLPPGSKVLDFGYGYIGHLRMLASMGLEVTGIDVHPLLRALYSEPGDQGPVAGSSGRAGSVRLLDGHFPKDAGVVAAAGSGYRFVVSKNVLKKGYIHPDRPADPKHLIDLGAADQVVLKSFFDALAPGGLFLVYNICPAPSPPDRPFVPWSDGRSPFARSQWEGAGFEVIAFDVDDAAKVREMGRMLDWDKGPEPWDLEKDLSVLYTLVRRPGK